MNTNTLTTSDLEELLDAEIPCGGIDTPVIKRSCQNAAVLMSIQHGCKRRVFKCISCWQILYQYYVRVFIRYDNLYCSECHQNFSSVEAFSDYRPL